MERVKVVENILSANDRLAEQNRRTLDQAGVLAVNFIASPGAGKTSVIEKTVRLLADKIKIGVIDGDIATSLDADRAAAVGAQAIQINTGGECHLDAVMVSGALQQLDLNSLDFIIVENVGNLVCPINFNLGTHLNVLIASIPEGDDKPYKYPGTYQGVDILIVNKIDLLPYVPFDMQRFLRGVEMLNPGIKAFHLSCRTGEGFDLWIEWIFNKIRNIH